MTTTLALLCLLGAVPAGAGEVEYRDDQRAGAPEQITRGGELYAQHCGKCHLADGGGRVGTAPRLVEPNLLAIVGNAFILRTITDGTHDQRIEVPPDDLVAVMAYLRSKQDRSGVKLDESALKGDPEKGKLLFRGTCAPCHGVNARGYHEGALAPPIGTPRFLNRTSDGMLRALIEHGKKGTPMMPNNPASPAAPPLTAVQVDGVIAWLRQQAAPEKTEAAPPEAAPKTP